MPRSIELVLQDGESLSSALRRFKEKVQQENEKRSTKESLARKLRRKLPKQGALLDTAIQQMKARFAQEPGCDRRDNPRKFAR